MQNTVKQRPRNEIWRNRTKPKTPPHLQTKSLALTGHALPLPPPPSSQLSVDRQANSMKLFLTNERDCVHALYIPTNKPCRISDKYPMNTERSRKREEGRESLYPSCASKKTPPVNKKQLFLYVNPLHKRHTTTYMYIY